MYLGSLLELATELHGRGTLTPNGMARLTDHGPDHGYDAMKTVHNKLK